MTYVDIELEEMQEEMKFRIPAPVEPPPAKPQSGKRTSPALRWGLAGLLVLLALSTTAGVVYYRGRVSTDDAQVDGPITPVAAKIYGNIAEVLVKDNQSVKAGQVLVRIDPRDYEAKVEMARAALSLAEGQARAAEVGVPLTRDTTQSGIAASAAQLSSAEADLSRATLAFEIASGSDLGAARANVEARQAAFDRAKADLERMRPLVAKAEISRQQFDAYQAAARVAASELEAAKEKLSSAAKDAEIRRAAMQAARGQLEQARAGLQAAHARSRQTEISVAQAVASRAAVDQARANLNAAELQRSYTEIVAPVDGVVTKKSVETGQIVQPGQGLLTLVPLDRVWITANFKETQLAQVRPGQRVEVKVDMYGETFAGRVESIAGATGTRLSLLPPENATGNYVKVVQRIPVRIALDAIPQDKAILRPGMNVVTTVFTQ